MIGSKTDRAGQYDPYCPADVADQEEDEPLPDIELQLCGQHFEMTIERFAVMIGIYYELPHTGWDTSSTIAGAS
ncbi:hypothetical protein R6Q57_024999 [Mikania cordata]